jgi:hypothetical protein
MFQSLAVLFVALSTATVVGPVRATSAFDFSVDKQPKKPKGLLGKVLDRVDGGDFHGYDNTDGTSHKANDPLRTMTVRFKFHF